MPRWTDWIDRVRDRLGTVPDAELADEIGVSEETIRRVRNRLGINPQREEREWTQDEVALLGTDTDRKVAEAIGRTRIQVTIKRQRLGINPSRERKGVAKYRTADSSLRSATLSDRGQRLLDRLAPVIIEEMRSKGVPINGVTVWQVLEIALVEAAVSRGIEDDGPPKPKAKKS